MAGAKQGMAEERDRASRVLQRREAARPVMCPASTGAGFWSVQWWCSIGSLWVSKPPCLPWVNLISAHHIRSTKCWASVGPASRNGEHL